MKNWAALFAVLTLFTHDAYAFAPTWSALYSYFGHCINDGEMLEVYAYGSNVRPGGPTDGISLGYLGAEQCLNHEYGGDGTNVSDYKHFWAFVRPSDAIAYSEYSRGTPPPPPTRPSMWQKIVYVGPVVVGETSDISVPLIDRETGSYSYDAQVQGQECVDVSTSSVISGVKPLAIRITGLDACNFNVVISIRATRK